MTDELRSDIAIWKRERIEDGFTTNDLVDRLVARVEELQRLASEQAKDEGLWFITDDIATNYVQEGLRRLHREIEKP